MRIFAIILLVCSLFSCGIKQEIEPPNVIYILADDMGYGDVSKYNPQGKIHTPQLDALANEGMMFTDAHTSSAVCTPTRYGILTGRYNWRSRLKSGVLTGKSKALIPSSRTTVASMLQLKGYYTAFVGKWHLGWDWALKDSVDHSGEGWDKEDFEIIDFSQPVKNTPNDLGFDYAYGFSGSLDMAPYVYVENGRVTSSNIGSSVNTGKYSWWREGPTADDFIHEAVTPHLFDKAEGIITEQAQTNKPFFLYLALPSPHTPILPTTEWQEKSQLHPYGDFVMMIDDYIGRLVELTKELGIEENTMIVFASDNGCAPAAGIDELEAKGHFPSQVYRGYKADIFEGGHRIPFIIKWPKRIYGGGINEGIVCTTDLLATLADIVGYELRDHEAEDSFSMFPSNNQEDGPKPKRNSIIHHSVDGSFAIRKGDWKLVMAPGSGGWSFPSTHEEQSVLDSLPPIQLYDLLEDPSETMNLWDKYPEVVHELQNILVEQISNGRSTPGMPQQNDAIEGEWEQLWFME